MSGINLPGKIIRKTPQLEQAVWTASLKLMIYKVRS